MRHAATVFSKAAVDLIAKGKAIAAVVLGTAPDSVVVRRRPLRRARHQPHLRFSRTRRRGGAAQAAGERCKDGLAVVTDNEMHEPVFPNGTAICEVEIDPDTGEIAITRYASSTMSAAASIR